jgi:hypothetical protein
MTDSIYPTAGWRSLWRQHIFYRRELEIRESIVAFQLSGREGNFFLRVQLFNGRLIRGNRRRDGFRDQVSTPCSRGLHAIRDQGLSLFDRQHALCPENFISQAVGNMHQSLSIQSYDPRTFQVKVRVMCGHDGIGRNGVFQFPDAPNPSRYD